MRALLNRWSCLVVIATMKEKKKRNNIALITAAEAGNLDRVKGMIEQGVDPNSMLKNGYSALMSACESGHEAIASFLIEIGANVDAKVDTSDMLMGGETALIQACRRDSVTLIKRLLSSGADADVKSEDGRTPIGEACKIGNLSIVKLLLRKGASFHGYNVLTALRCGHLELTRFLVNRGCDIDFVGARGSTLLGLALEKNITSMIEFLVRKGADVNRLSDDQTPLIYAVLNRNTKILKLLLRTGADANGQNVVRRTALHAAASIGDVAAAKLLVSHGAKVGAKSRFSRTPLDEAIHGNQSEMITYLKLVGGKDGLDGDGSRNAERETRRAAKPKRSSKRKHPKSTFAKGGSEDFRKWMFEGHAEWSLWAVEAPLDKVVKAFALLRKGETWAEDVVANPPKRKGLHMANMVPVVRIKGSSWVVGFRTVSYLDGKHISAVQEEAKWLSQKLKARALSFMHEDTSSCTGYDLFENGEFVEGMECLGECIQRFDSDLRRKPAKGRVGSRFPDKYFREFGVYIPACALDQDSKSMFMTIEPVSEDLVERVDQ